MVGCIRWGELCLSGESIQTGQSMLRLWVARRALCPPATSGEDCWGEGWSLSSPDNQHPTGQLQHHTAREPVFWYCTNSDISADFTGGWDTEEAQRLKFSDSRGCEWGAHLVLILVIMECDTSCTWVVKSKIPCYINKQARATQREEQCWVRQSAQGARGRGRESRLGREVQAENEEH